MWTDRGRIFLLWLGGKAMTKSLSVLNKLTVDQFKNLVYPVTELSFYFIVENGKIYLIEEGTEV